MSARKHKLGLVLHAIVLAAVLGEMPGSYQAIAQTEPPHTLSADIRSAIGQLQTVEKSDWKPAEARLTAALANPDLRTQALLGLALFQVKRGNHESVGKFLDKHATYFPTPSPDVKLILLRLQLWHAVVSNDVENANLHFRELVRSVGDARHAPTNKTACASMLGSITAMLEPNIAMSPIPSDDILKTKAFMERCTDAQSKVAFQNAYRVASKHVTSLINWLNEYQPIPMEDAIAKANENQTRLTNDMDEQKLLTDSFRIEERVLRKEIIRQSNEKERIRVRIAHIQATWNRHPEIHNPIPPNRAVIALHVPRTERVKTGSHRERKTRTVKYLDKGEWKEKSEDYWDEVDDYETVQRSRSEIEGDIERIFRPLQQRYLYLMAQAKDLRDQRKDQEKQLAAADTAISNARDQIKANDEAIRTKTKEFEKRRWENARETEVINALRIGKPESIFRPIVVHSIDYFAEAQVLWKLR
jgi:hypothetical protein